jgi:hypothetical protein
LNIGSNPLPELDPALIEQLKGSVSEPLFEKLQATFRLNQERLARLERENRLLRELRRLDLLEKYGPAGEGLSDAQLELLELEPGVSSAEYKDAEVFGRMNFQGENQSIVPGSGHPFAI